MNARRKHEKDEGFTLVEVLVTVLILGLLAAVVFPVVIQQVDKADPTAASNDLANLRSGIELFSLDVRPKQPSELEHLSDAIATTESDVDGTSYESSDTDAWDGPYIDAAIGDGTSRTATSVATGFDAELVNGLAIYDQSANSVASTTGGVSSADFIAINFEGLTSSDFTDLNDQIDGEGESTPEDNGRLRVVDSNNYSDSTFFLAVPVRN